MRKSAIFVTIALLVGGVVLFAYPRLTRHTIELTVRFQDANGLRAGAPVRLAGVEVGSVVSVRVRPEMQVAPAEVKMRLLTPYELKVPSDSTVSAETAGVLGETFLAIDVKGTFGGPAKNGEVLKAKETKPLSGEEILKRVEELVHRKPCGPQESQK